MCTGECGSRCVSENQRTGLDLVKYNFATTGEGGAIRGWADLSFSHGEFAVIYFLLCDMSLVRINQFFASFLRVN